MKLQRALRVYFRPAATHRIRCRRKAEVAGTCCASRFCMKNIPGARDAEFQLMARCDIRMRQGSLIR
jgi:hypothetical protein